MAHKQSLLVSPLVVVLWREQRSLGKVSSDASHVPQVTSVSCSVTVWFWRCNQRSEGHLWCQHDSCPLSGSWAAWISALGPRNMIN